MRWLLLATVHLLPFMMLNAQEGRGQSRVDSILARARQVATDTARCRLLLEAARQYQELDPERGVRVGLEGLEIAQRIGDPERIGNAYAVIARNYQVSGRQDEALDYVIKAEQAYGKLTDKLPGLKLKLLKAKVYSAAGRLQQAIDLSRQVRDEARNEMNEMPCLAAQNHAAFLVQARRKEEALAFLDEAIAQGTQYGASSCVLHALSLAASIHADEGRMVEGLDMMQQALEQSIVIGNKLLQSIMLNNMAYSLVDAAALPADRLDPRLGSRRAMLDRAKECAIQAVEIAQQGNYHEVIQNGWYTLARVQEAREEYREALGTFQRFYHVYDSVKTADHSAAMTRLEGEQKEMLLKRDLEEKDGQLDSARELRIRLSMALGMAFLGAGALLLQNRRVRRARHRSDELLLNILPAATAQELKETGTTTPRQYDYTTVLFTDFVGFTRVLEGYQPQEVVELIDAYFRPFDRIVQRHGLEKIKTIGDAYMAVCGVPNERPDHAVAAVRAALEMLAFVKTESARRAAAGIPHVRIRIGLHSGPVVAGVVGESKFAFDIWGDTVNTAARFEQHGEVDRVNISRSTYEQVKHHFRCTSRGTVTVKHGVELELFQVEGEVV